jgi:hypothetical protein
MERAKKATMAQNEAEDREQHRPRNHKDRLFGAKIPLSFVSRHAEWETPIPDAPHWRQNRSQMMIRNNKLAFND